MQPFRIQPALPVEAVKTYRILAPLATHWRPATCAEIDCQHYAHGWATTVAAGSADEALIRRAGRRYTAEHQPGGFIRFVFEPGQPCFAVSRHRTPIERPQVYQVHRGDWRGMQLLRTHVKAEDWQEDFAEHQDKLHDAIERG